MVSKSTPMPAVPPIARGKQDKKDSRDPVLSAIRKTIPKGRLASSIPLDPAVDAWSEQLTDLFHRKSKVVGCPLFESNFPCPTTLVTNYATSGLSGQIAYGIICPVQGAYYDVGDEKYHSGSATFAGPVTRGVGPIMSGAVNKTVAGVVVNGTMADCYANTTTSTAIDWPQLSSPFNSGTSAAMDYRTVAYGVRITFTGPLSETEGWVEMVQPYEPMYGTSAASAFDQFRRDRSYRKDYFSSKRTYEYYYSPTCDDIKFVQDKSNTALAASEVSSRFCLRIGGLKTTDILQIEFVAVQEWVGHLSIPTQQPRLVTPDATHVVNALVAGHGALNQKGEPNHAQIARAMKVATHGHSWLKSITDSARPLLEDARAAVDIVKAGAKVWNSVSGIFTA